MGAHSPFQTTVLVPVAVGKFDSQAKTKDSLSSEGGPKSHLCPLVHI